MLLKYSWLIALPLLVACLPTRNQLNANAGGDGLTGREFYRQAVSYGWKQRDSLALCADSMGNVPTFFYHFQPIHSSFTDSLNQPHHATFYVSSDYFAVGQNNNWARVPLTPLAGQVLADRHNCFLPTRKIVDLIYTQSKLKLEPMPMYAYRDSTITMYHHHLMVEGQRKGRKGLIAGIKKDVVLCTEEAMKGRTHRVAIYGWHKLDGKAIQPLYTGHVDWYADYSHGIRLIYRKIKVDGKWMDYTELFGNPLLSPLLSDENGKQLLRY
jgi:hypothetical protein